MPISRLKTLPFVTGTQPTLSSKSKPKLPQPITFKPDLGTRYMPSGQNRVNQGDRFSRKHHVIKATDDPAERLRKFQEEPEQQRKFREENETGKIYERPDESPAVKERNDERGGDKGKK